jgi:hypothetical protein
VLHGEEAANVEKEAHVEQVGHVDVGTHKMLISCANMSSKCIK